MAKINRQRLEQIKLGLFTAIQIRYRNYLLMYKAYTTFPQCLNYRVIRLHIIIVGVKDRLSYVSCNFSIMSME